MRTPGSLPFASLGTARKPSSTTSPCLYSITCVDTSWVNSAASSESMSIGVSSLQCAYHSGRPSEREAYAEVQFHGVLAGLRVGIDPDVRDERAGRRHEAESRADRIPNLAQVHPRPLEPDAA